MSARSRDKAEDHTIMMRLIRKPYAARKLQSLCFLHNRGYCRLKFQAYIYISRFFALLTLTLT